MKRYLCLFSMRTRPIIFLKHLWLFLVQPKQTSLLWSIPSICSSAKYVSSVCCNLTMPKHNDMDDYKNTNLFSLFVGNEVIVQRGSICCPLLCCAVPHLGHTPWTRRGSVALFKGAMAGSSRRTQLCAVTFGEALWRERSCIVEGGGWEGIVVIVTVMPPSLFPSCTGGIKGSLPTKPTLPFGAMFVSWVSQSPYSPTGRGALWSLSSQHTSS